MPRVVFDICYTVIIMLLTLEFFSQDYQVIANQKTDADLALIKKSEKIPNGTKRYTNLVSRQNISINAVIGQSNASWIESKAFFGIDGDPTIKFAVESGNGTPWPMPKKYNTTFDRYLIDIGSVEFSPLGYSCDILDFNIRRIRVNLQAQNSYLRPNNGNKLIHEFSRIPFVYINIEKPCDLYPSLESNESYILTVSESSINIEAEEIWGAIRGIETLSHIVYESGVRHLFFINQTIIEDSPRFAHRGILIDTARHFITKDNIILNLEAMAQNKLNVFHWHIVDDQSFPFQSHIFPELSKKGAFHPVTHIYTQKDVKQIIEEARLRGIRVIPEFDTPGHVLSWGYSHPELLTKCEKWPSQYGPMNPFLNTTYTFMELLYSEILRIFPDQYVHMGGDEVSVGCWVSNSFIDQYMKNQRNLGYHNLLIYYLTRLYNIIQNVGQIIRRQVSTIVWLDGSRSSRRYHNESIVQIWQGHGKVIKRLVRRGIRVIYSSCWYLDNLDSHVDWYKFYICEEKLQSHPLFIGGEACMWTEYVDNSNILQTIWPRSSAAAERLWSPSHVASIVEASPRIEEQRCRMKRRGIPVSVASGPGYCKSSQFINPVYYSNEGSANSKGKTVTNYTKRKRSTDRLVSYRFNSTFSKGSTNFECENCKMQNIVLLVVDLKLFILFWLIVTILVLFIYFKVYPNIFFKLLRFKRKKLYVRMIIIVTAFLFIYMPLCRLLSSE